MSHHFRTAALAAAGALLLPLACLAQAPVPAPKVEVPASQLRAAPSMRMQLPAQALRMSPVRQTAAAAIVDGAYGDSLAASSQPLLPVAALVGFSLEYGRGGDHKLRRIGVLARERFAELSLADRSDAGPFSGRADYVVFDRGLAGEVTAYGGGAFDIPLPSPVPSNSTLVLRGFEFRRQDGTDANLRQIGVWLDPEHNKVRVSLTDDQGADFRGFDRELMNAFLAGNLPFGIIAGTATTIADGARRLEAAGGPHRAYAVTVQYAWIPNEMVTDSGVMTGSRSASVSGRLPTANAAIQGFDFTFIGGDHHLGAIAVTPRRRGSPVGFRDSNLDDPMQWRLGYAQLKPMSVVVRPPARR